MPGQGRTALLCRAPERLCRRGQRVLPVRGNVPSGVKISINLGCGNRSIAPLIHHYAALTGARGDARYWSLTLEFGRRFTRMPLLGATPP
ncbi:MAG: hypothetical protein AB1796_05540 [Bacillota bacterium]